MKQFDSEWFLGRLAEVRRSQAELSRFLEMDKATVHNMLRGKRRLQITEVEPVARFLDITPFEVLRYAGIEFDSFPTIPPIFDGDQHEVIYEADIRKLIKNGATMTTDGIPAECLMPVPWGLPVAYAKTELGIDTKNSVILEIHGDGMAPTLNSGDRVVADTSDTTPSPPGIFALWEGIGITYKRIEHVIGERPAKIHMQSDNLAHENVTVPLDAIVIIGRVKWAAKKM